MLASKYSLTYLDAQGNAHQVVLEASSGTAAIALAMEQSEEIRLHPNRITRVRKEEPTNGDRDWET